MLVSIVLFLMFDFVFKLLQFFYNCLLLVVRMVTVIVTVIACVCVCMRACLLFIPLSLLDRSVMCDVRGANPCLQERLGKLNVFPSQAFRAFKEQQSKYSSWVRACVTRRLILPFVGVLFRVLRRLERLPLIMKPSLVRHSLFPLTCCHRPPARANPRPSCRCHY